MVWLALIIGTFNLALGYLAAAFLCEIPPWEGRHWPRLSLRRTTRRPPPPVPSNSVQHTAPPVPAATVDELPPRWREALAAEGLVAQSFVEAILHRLRIDAARHREQLLAAEGRAWALKGEAAAGDYPALVDDLRYVVRDWLDEEKGITALLAQQRSRLAGETAVGELLEQFLLDQAAEIRAAETAIAALSDQSDSETGGRPLHAELGRLIDLVHARRDELLELLVGLGHPSRRAAWPMALAYDAAIGLPGRLALETKLDNWWRADPYRQRPLSLVLIDIDRFSRINTRYGSRAGDRCLGALARLLGEFVPKDREHEHLLRSGGQSFCLVLGDTSPSDALALAERIRQSVEAATFDDQSSAFELTLSCGVVEAGRDDAALVWRRLQDTLKLAKRAGRNRCLQEGTENSEPPQYSVKGRTVSLHEPSRNSSVAPLGDVDLLPDSISTGEYASMTATASSQGT